MGSLAKKARAQAAQTTLTRAADADHDPADLGGKAGVKLLDIPLADLTLNPRNPRKENLSEDPRTIELAGSMKDFGQLQSAVVITRATYLEQWPEDADKIPTAYVLMIGNRRWAAAGLNDWPTLECLLRIASPRTSKSLVTCPCTRTSTARASTPSRWRTGSLIR